jgi:uncharacterized protein (TIGR00255 family)
MIRSMTGFGSANAEYKTKAISIDIKSLNSKYFDLNLRLPSEYRDKDLELRTELARELERGKIEVIISLEAGESEPATSINKLAFEKYYKELKVLDKKFKLGATDFLNVILRLPDAVITQEEKLDEKEWTLIRKTLDKAVKAFQSFRDKEGKFMEGDLKERIAAIEKSLKRIDETDGARIENLRRRMQDNLNEYFSSENIDKNRFEQELLFYIEKMDISEEKVRLRSHCDYFISTMKEDSNGKKLGFISQEMGREINTLGAKANDASIQKLVVEMKDELEKIKELLMNVL